MMMMKVEEKLPLGPRLKKIRKALGLSQKDFASGLEISNTYLSEIESGKGNPGFKFFHLLCREYNVSIDYVINGTGEMFRDQVMDGAVKPVQPDLNNLESIETLGELVWLLENSSILRHNIFSFAGKFLFENHELILKNLKAPDSRSVSKKSGLVNRAMGKP